MYNLPIDIQRRIWEYDGRRDNFDMEVIPYLQQDWFIKWIELDASGNPYGKYGIDLTDDVI